MRTGRPDMGGASDLAHSLGDHAEAVCRRYLSNGRRSGRYWLVGDVLNSKGRSLYVRLADSPSGRGVRGKWTDSATGEHGDLLDIIARACNHVTLRETLDEARHFLSLPLPEPANDRAFAPRDRAPTGSREAARRLFAASETLTERAEAAEIEALALDPRLDDFNADLQMFGVAVLAAHVAPQLRDEDVARFLVLSG